MPSMFLIGTLIVNWRKLPKDLAHDYAEKHVGITSCRREMQ